MPEPIMSDIAFRLKQLAQQSWTQRSSLLLIGTNTTFVESQQKLEQFASIDRPVLITGESGVGKEGFARSLYLLSKKRGKPFLTVNCAQYQDENLLVSELFGHKKGSFTGATTEHKGLFQEANGGVLFLDEVAELSAKAQAMLLRALSEGEIKALGTNKTTSVDVRVVAATNRNLEQMVEEKTFRKDLYYRLRYLRLKIPPLRDRGNDWRLIAQYYLECLNRKSDKKKRFSESTLSLLSTYHWPGNVREVQGIADIGYCLSHGEWIEPESVREELDAEKTTSDKSKRLEIDRIADSYYRDMLEEGKSFWEVVRDPFLDRELNREEVRAIVLRGLTDTQGSYKKLLECFHVNQSEYLKFMDFLRHHRLKPQRTAA